MGIMDLFTRTKKNTATKVQIATFFANDADVADKFVRKLTASADEHEYDLDETETDRFTLFFVINGEEDRDGDLENAVEALGKFSKSELTMAGIFDFKIEVGKERELN